MGNYSNTTCAKSILHKSSHSQEADFSFEQSFTVWLRSTLLLQSIISSIGRLFSECVQNKWKHHVYRFHTKKNQTHKTKQTALVTSEHNIPPGTGVIQLALFFAPWKSTSPRRRRPLFLVSSKNLRGNYRM